MFYQALRSANVPVEMHLYEKGPHGFGMHQGLGPTSDWPKRCEEWMRFHGWLAPVAAAPPTAATTPR
jgi:acetyl esterase/lipase